VRRRATLAFSVVFVVIGLALVVETALVGGQIGYVLGLLFVLAGLLRAYLTLAGRQR
jgi:hypothetical protein